MPSVPLAAHIECFVEAKCLLGEEYLTDAQFLRTLFVDHLAGTDVREISAQEFNVLITKMPGVTKVRHNGRNILYGITRRDNIQTTLSKRKAHKTEEERKEAKRLANKRYLANQRQDTDQQAQDVVNQPVISLRIVSPVQVTPPVKSGVRSVQRLTKVPPLTFPEPKLRPKVNPP